MIRKILNGLPACRVRSNPSDPWSSLEAAPKVRLFNKYAGGRYWEVSESDARTLARYGRFMQVNPPIHYVKLADGRKGYLQVAYDATKKREIWSLELTPDSMMVGRGGVRHNPHPADNTVNRLRLIPAGAIRFIEGVRVKRTGYDVFELSLGGQQRHQYSAERAAELLTAKHRFDAIR